jgi:general secretion pathway protein G
MYQIRQNSKYRNIHRMNITSKQTACNQKGVTLLEVLVVLSIMAIIAGLALPRIMQSRENALVDATKTQIGNVVSALNMYKLDNFAYPTSEQGMNALVQKPGGQPAAPNWRGPYLEKTPTDAWNRPLQYLSPGQHGAIDVYSLGADGQPGGEGNDSDIGNWSEK